MVKYGTILILFDICLQVMMRWTTLQVKFYFRASSLR